MGIVGADVDELRELGERFMEASRRLESLRTTVASSVRSSGWSGSDADGIKGKIDLGAALGIGGKISLDVDIEPAKLVDDIGSMFGF